MLGGQNISDNHAVVKFINNNFTI
ncbi:MAG: hypothetical protein ACK52J_00115 [bacterium]